MKVISHKNLPTRLPLLSTGVVFLLLDRFGAPQWLWGALGLLFLLMWCVAVIMLLKQEQVEILPLSQSKGGES